MGGGGVGGTDTPELPDGRRRKVQCRDLQGQTPPSRLPASGTKPKALLPGAPRVDRHQDTVASSGKSRRPVKAHMGLATSNECPSVAGAGDGQIAQCGEGPLG